MKKIIYTILFLLLISSILSAQTLNTSSVGIIVGHKGIVAPNQWNPLRLQTDRNNADTVTAEIIRQDIDGNNSPPETFPFTGNRLEASFFADNSAEKIIIRIKDNDHLIMEKSLNTTGSLFPGHLILTTISASGIRQAIGKILYPEETVQTLLIDYDDLPDHLLNYDGITGIIISDPGLLLNPGQVEALKGWISAGGTLIIYSPLQFSKSLASRMDPENFPVSKNDRIVMNTGYGKLIILTKSIDEISGIQNSNFWQQMLDLKQYNAYKKRLTAGKIFPLTGMIPNKFRNNMVRLKLASFLPVWISGVIFLTIFFKRKFWLVSLAATILFTLIAVPFAQNTRKAWQRGSVSHTRAVILPDHQGVYLNTVIQAWPVLLFSAISPWGIKAGFGTTSTGIINQNIYTGWIHLTKHSAYNIRDGNKGILELTGYISNPSASRGIHGNYVKSLTDDNEEGFLHSDNSSLFIWKENSAWSSSFSGQKIILQNKMEFPNGFEFDLSWLEWLSNHYPGKSWIIGKGKLTFLDLRIMDNINSETTWAYPLTEGDFK